MLRRRVTSLAFAAIGLGLVLAPERYQAPSYRVLTDFMQPQWWGASFLIVAAALALRPVHRYIAAAMAASLLSSWTVALIITAATDPQVSPTGWVWTALLTALIALSCAPGGRG